jgi:hypothetical protein
VPVSRKRTIVVQAPTPLYDKTVAATGIDPQALFPEGGAGHGDSCGCVWSGHRVFRFAGTGGDGGQAQAAAQAEEPR